MCHQHVNAQNQKERVGDVGCFNAFSIRRRTGSAIPLTAISVVAHAESDWNANNSTRGARPRSVSGSREVIVERLPVAEADSAV